MFLNLLAQQRSLGRTPTTNVNLPLILKINVVFLVNCYFFSILDRMGKSPLNVQGPHNPSGLEYLEYARYECYS
jgi:hypothetical protein